MTAANLSLRGVGRAWLLTAATALWAGAPARPPELLWQFDTGG